MGLILEVQISTKRMNGPDFSGKYLLLHKKTDA
jgi:hypothetical protein